MWCNKIYINLCAVTLRLRLLPKRHPVSQPIASSIQTLARHKTHTHTHTFRVKQIDNLILLFTFLFGFRFYLKELLETFKECFDSLWVLNVGMRHHQTETSGMEWNCSNSILALSENKSPFGKYAMLVYASKAPELFISIQFILLGRIESGFKNINFVMNWTIFFTIFRPNFANQSNAK